MAILAAGLLLAACASGPKYADMKSSIPPLASDKGRIYFYRSSSMAGGAIQPHVVLNGETVGSSKPGGFFYVDRAPGNYEATCSTEVERKATFVLAAGQERFIKTSISMGLLGGHVTPELVDNAIGQTALQGLHYSPDKAEKK
jgi:hypothetical protein